MNKLTHAQAVAMLDLQDRVNALEDSDWMKKESAHLRSAWQICAGLINHLEEANKEQSPEMKTAYDEIVKDHFVWIWEYMMSEWLQSTPKDEGITDAAGLLVSTLYDEQFWSATQEATLQRHTEIMTLIDAFVHLCSARSFNAHIFARMMQLCGMTWADMYQRIVHENLLDVFRAGYKDYVSDWNGESDSETLKLFMQERPDDNIVELLNRMEVAYASEVARRGAS